MGCGSSKEIDSYEEKGIVRKDSPPAYTEKERRTQMQVRAPQQAYINKTSSGCAPAPMSHSHSLEKAGFKDSSAQQAPCSRPSFKEGRPARVERDGFPAEQAQLTQRPPARAFTQYEPKRKPMIQAAPKAQHKGPSLLTGSPFHCDEPDSPAYGDAVFHESLHNVGNAQKKGQLGHADPARRPRKAVVQIDLTNCTGRWCKTRLTPDDIANWKWIRETRDNDAKPKCARCLAEQQQEDNKWAKTSMGGFIDMSDTRQTHAQDFVQGQYSPI
ncbi:MAG: hypothetical protein OHK93_005308 [Ramalina farinacea]|uniref:Uncharacterized protein n=1 Tax=Ramalina farinacea TaxID=258253 RepID=A0AA43TZ99_9LECA|nr:hypothetical protein [Ramalina farinacea]